MNSTGHDMCLEEQQRHAKHLRIRKCLIRISGFAHICSRIHLCHVVEGSFPHLPRNIQMHPGHPATETAYTREPLGPPYGGCASLCPAVQEIADASRSTSNAEPQTRVGGAYGRGVLAQVSGRKVQMHPVLTSNGNHRHVRGLPLGARGELHPALQKNSD
jgi:hypothetical protein